MTKITSIHDKFVRTILADKGVAIEYFRNYLPRYVSSQIDFSTLTQIPDTYLSRQLQKTMSDIVYSCQKTDGGEIKISLLIEHKSHPDRFTPVQIGGYIFSGLQKQIENKEKLSIIIPILFYHGNEKWKYQNLKGIFEGVDEEWEKFIPNFEYIYNNLNEIPDEQVEAISNKFLIASLLALKYSFNKNWLENNASKVLILTEEATENLQKSFIVYFFGNSKLEADKIAEILEPLPLKLKAKVMSTLDILIDKGRQEGVEKTELKIIRNLLKTSALSDEQIASVADVTLDFVRKVRAELNS